MGWDDHKNKCISCGFLALKPVSQIDYLHGKVPFSPNAYYEADTYARQRVKFDTHCPEGFVGAIRTQPACFRRIASLTAEISHYSEEHGGERPATEVVLKSERNCAAWYCYIEGFSPKEHLFMLRFELLEKNRQEFEERLEVSRKDYEMRAEKERRDWNTALELRLETDRRDWIDKRDAARNIEEQNYNKLMKRLTLIAAGLALIQVLVALAALTQDTLLVKLLRRLFTSGE